MVKCLHEDSGHCESRVEFKDGLVGRREPGREAPEVPLKAPRLLVDVAVLCIGSANNAQDGGDNPSLEGGGDKESDGQAASRDIAQTNGLKEGLPVGDEMGGRVGREAGYNKDRRADVHRHEDGREEGCLLARDVKGRRGRRHGFDFLFVVRVDGWWCEEARGRRK